MKKDNNSNKCNTNKCNTQQVSNSNKEGRDENGRFVPGMTPVVGTPFEPNNTLACKYKEEYCDSIIAYFNNPDIAYPTFELFANSINVTNGTLLNWCKQYPRFASVYARAKEIQCGKSIEGGCTGKYDSNFLKFYLINQHGFKDKREIAAEVTGISPEQQKLLDNLNKRLGEDKA